jgi:TonB family protein
MVSVRFEMQKVRFVELMDSLKSRTEHLREAAARNLGGMSASYGIRKREIEQAIRRLEQVAEQDESPRVREAAQRALSSLDKRPLPPGILPGAPGPGEARPAADAEASAAAAAEGAPGPPAPEMSFDTPPRALHTVRPEYPREAFEKRIEGTVLIEALVDSDGVIARCRVIQSVPGLDAAALAAARQWRFRPAVKDGKPVATIIHMPVQFSISKEKK